MRRGPYRLLFLAALLAAAGCATSGDLAGGGPGPAAYDCWDPSLAMAGYGYAPPVYDEEDNPCLVFPSRYYFYPRPGSSLRDVLAEAPRPRTQVVQRPPSSFSPMSSINANYGFVSNDTYSPTSVNAMPVMPTSSSPTTTTVAPRH
jgi:hypothetical protein